MVSFSFLKKLLSKKLEVMISLTTPKFGELSCFALYPESQTHCVFGLVFRFFVAVFPLVK